MIDLRNRIEFLAPRISRAKPRVASHHSSSNPRQCVPRKAACEVSEHSISHHFVDVNKMVELGSGSQREVNDVMLTHYACILIGQNGDPQKEPIAFAQTYFAIHNARTKEMQLEGQISSEHVTNNQAERDTLLTRGIVPEDFPQKTRRVRKLIQQNETQRLLEEYPIIS